VLEQLGPAQEVEMESANEIGVAIKFRDDVQLVPLARIRAATIVG
jgi:hypothetical protein